MIFFQLIVAFGYKVLSFYLLPASQLFKVPIGHCYYLTFISATRSCVLTQTTQLESVLLLWLLLLFFRKRVMQQRKRDTVMSLSSSWKCDRLSQCHKGALVSLFIYRLLKIKEVALFDWSEKLKMVSSTDLFSLKKKKKSRKESSSNLTFLDLVCHVS